MKRLLPFIPVLLFLLVNSCAPAADPPDPNNTTAIANTIFATIWTATPPPTSSPAIPIIVNWLNADLSSPTNSLEATLDAQYSVTDILFQNAPNSTALIFRMNVGCICKNSADCCIPERTFVVIIESMKKTSVLNFVQLPGNINQMMVVCSDPKAKSPFGAISASWQDVQGYLQGGVLGYQLGARVTRITVP